jgi:predicted phosphodiesterase/energy-coupling factor transporter ATP-binding protein EcfA2
MHLSDLHVGGEDWQRDDVLGALVRDLPELLAERELRPDLLFVTGDVASRGRREEYDGAFVVLEKLTHALGLERREHVFLVPGNHDVDRSRIGGMASLHHQALIQLGPDALSDTLGKLLEHAKELGLYGERLSEWCAFTDRFLGRARSVTPERPWRADVVPVHGVPVGVLSLCTVWASGGDREHGKLMLGERQLRDLLAEAYCGGARLVVALMHHPLSWLHPEEHSAIRGRLEREVDVVLHGHSHEAHTAVQIAAGSTHATLGAGAAYAGLGQDRYHGFTIGRLDPLGGKLEAHHFTWSTRSAKWHLDTGAPGVDEKGRVIVRLHSAAHPAAKSLTGELEVLATRLRTASANVYATVDFAGLGLGGPRKHVTLDQIYIPLDLRAEPPHGAHPSLVDAEVRERGSGDGPLDHSGMPSMSVMPGIGARPGRLTLEGLEELLVRARPQTSTGARLVVLGEPGSGKSTLSRYLATAAAHHDGGPVPLLLTVRDWMTHGKHEQLLEMAARQATEVLSVRTDPQALEGLCEQGRVLLVVDGLDEAGDPAMRRDLRDRIHGFVASQPHVPIVVTSRLAGYHEVSLNEDFDHLSLEPFDQQSLEHFVHRWYDLIEDDPAERLRKRVDLLHALEVEPRTNALARNPLLATLIGMVHSSSSRIPGGRARLYGMMVELLLVTWPAERRRELPELPGAVQQPLLEKLALRLQVQRASTSTGEQNAEVLVELSELKTMLAELLSERFPERDPHGNQHLARQWSRWLVNDSGLLLELQPGHVGFLHLSLMEYLAGRALLGEHRGHEAVARMVNERHTDALWRETLLLMLGSENKTSELGQVVIEHLLESRAPGSEWWACMFGLAMLREDVAVGTQRERLLESTCRAVPHVRLRQWDDATRLVCDIVRFSRMHGEATRRWLGRMVTSAPGELLVGALGLASEVFARQDIDVRLSTRKSITTTSLALLDFGPRSPLGQWARKHATRRTRLTWALASPPECTVPRSLEGLATREHAGVWVPALVRRVDWLARTSAHAAARLREPGGPALPSASWWIAGAFPAHARLDCSLAAQPVRSNDHLGSARPVELAAELAAAFAQTYAPELVRSFSQGFELMAARRFALGFSVCFSGRLADPLLAFRPRDPDAGLSAWLDEELAAELARASLGHLAAWFEGHFGIAFDRGFADGHADALELVMGAPQARPAARLRWEELHGAATDEEIAASAASFFCAMLVEIHAALVAAPAFEEPEIVRTLATLRVQNRWLELFYGPLVEHATRTRPVAEHPDLHALLLMYGLVQHQTTWQWPEHPQWDAWLGGEPPRHWLPAHVWHLVRSIQDPDDPDHGARAYECLQRSGWPELARALRDITLVPTSPEVLALYDRGMPSLADEQAHAG